MCVQSVAFRFRGIKWIYIHIQIESNRVQYCASNHTYTHTPPRLIVAYRTHLNVPVFDRCVCVCLCARVSRLRVCVRVWAKQDTAAASRDYPPRVQFPFLLNRICARAHTHTHTDASEPTRSHDDRILGERVISERRSRAHALDLRSSSRAIGTQSIGVLGAHTHARTHTLARARRHRKPLHTTVCYACVRRRDIQYPNAYREVSGSIVCVRARAPAAMRWRESERRARVHCGYSCANVRMCVCV